MYLALKVSDLDNVATVFAEGIQAGAGCEDWFRIRRPGAGAFYNICKD